MDEYESNDERHDERDDAFELKVSISRYNSEHIANDVAEKLAEIVMRDQREAIKRMASEYVQKFTAAELEKVVAPVIESALDAKLSRTDAWGKVIGDPRSAREIIEEGAGEFLSTKVGQNGVAISKNEFSYSNYPTRLERMVGEVIDKKFDQEMKNGVVKLKAEVQANMQKAAAAWLADFQQKAVKAMG